MIERKIIFHTSQFVNQPNSGGMDLETGPEAEVDELTDDSNMMKSLGSEQDVEELFCEFEEEIRKKFERFHKKLREVSYTLESE
jgi:hypothetical protein